MKITFRWHDLVEDDKVYVVDTVRCTYTIPENNDNEEYPIDIGYLVNMIEMGYYVVDN